MELGSQIRRYRSERGMSQDALAGKIFVSRQTISNWENDRTYPDVQNLLFLSNLFDVTIDQLIKGDLDIMEKSIDSETKNLRRLGLVCGILTVFMFLTLIVGFALYLKLNKSDVILYATLALALITGILGIIAAAYIEQIKARNDVQTYREIKAFLSGEEVDRSKRSHFERKWLMPGNQYYKPGVQVPSDCGAGHLFLCDFSRWILFGCRYRLDSDSYLWHDLTCIGKADRTSEIRFCMTFLG